ncbi:hypothetical protein Angca_004554, partial [Angiostrongylus cantonensis]
MLLMFFEHAQYSWQIWCVCALDIDCSRRLLSAWQNYDDADAETIKSLSVLLFPYYLFFYVVKLSPKRLRTNREVRTVLPEEQYLDKLEKIIVRDYFPDLPKLKAQAEYMDAVKRNDIAKMRELQLRYHTGRRTVRSGTTPGHRAPTSPISFDPDTPGPSRPSDDVHGTPLPYANCEGDNEVLILNVQKKKPNPEELSVDAFMNKFTSEDNASFEELTAVEMAKERSKKGWIYEAEQKHNAEKV